MVGGGRKGEKAEMRCGGEAVRRKIERLVRRGEGIGVRGERGEVREDG